MVNYPPRIPLAHTPTPLQPLRRLQAQLGGPLIWLKRDDMTGSTLSGNKVRKLEFIAAKAQAEGYDALITCGGIQSNHCRATALVAAQLGMQCHLLLRGEAADPPVADGNLLLDELSGCSISFHPAKEYFSQLEKIAAERINDFAERGHKAKFIPTGGSDGDGVWGYIAACNELHQDFIAQQIKPQAIVTASGSGGTQAGLVVGSILFGLNADVYGINVCDDENYFLNKIAADISDWQELYPQQALEAGFTDADYRAAIHMIDGYVGKGYGIVSDQVLQTIKQLATIEGVVLDPVYSGKAFDGLLSEIKNGRFATAKDIVFIHTGGVFGLYAFKEQLALI